MAEIVVQIVIVVVGGFVLMTVYFGLKATLKPVPELDRVADARYEVKYWREKLVEQAELVRALELAGKALEPDRDLLLQYETNFRSAETELMVARAAYRALI